MNKKNNLFVFHLVLFCFLSKCKNSIMLILDLISGDVLIVCLIETRWVNREVAPARLKYCKLERGKNIYISVNQY